MIRPATREDAAAVAGISARGWTVGYASFLTKFPPALGAQEWEQRLTDSGYRTLVWDDGGAIGGFVSFGPTEEIDAEPPGTGIVLALYVDEPAQRRGVGSALLEAACEALAADGMHQAVLWTFSANARARAFYEARGWLADPGSHQPHHLVEAEELRYRRPL